jgi:hypothetical protein
MRDPGNRDRRKASTAIAKTLLQRKRDRHADNTKRHCCRYVADKAIVGAGKCEGPETAPNGCTGVVRTF